MIRRDSSMARTCAIVACICAWAMVAGISAVESAVRVLDTDALVAGTPPKYHAQMQTTRRWRKLARRTAADASPTFKIQFTCGLSGASTPGSADAQMCAQAAQGFENAGQVLAQLIRLRASIVVDAGFSSFCSVSGGSSIVEKDQTTATSGNGCSQRTLGVAAPMVYFELEDDVAAQLGLDSAYQYPAALYKQALASRNSTGSVRAPEASSVDIYARFNSAMPWWFSTAYSGDIDNTEYDFEQIVLHELMHGLGFLSGWYITNQNDARLGTTMLPSYLRFGNQGGVIGLGKPYIFDKYLYDTATQTWLADTAASLLDGVSTLNTTSSINAFYAQFAANATLYGLAARAYNAFSTPRGLLIWFPRWWRLAVGDSTRSLNASSAWDYAVIFTPTSFRQGSTGSHVDQDTYWATSDYLMRPFGTPGVSTDAYRPQSLYGAVGNTVLSVLQTLGYQTVLADKQFVQGIANGLTNTALSSGVFRRGAGIQTQSIAQQRAKTLQRRRRYLV